MFALQKVCTGARTLGQITNAEAAAIWRNHVDFLVSCSLDAEIVVGKHAKRRSMSRIASVPGVCFHWHISHAATDMVKPVHDWTP